MGESEEQSRSALPALYESPWLGLGRSLKAVLASLGLSARELWRRNRQGDLPRPSFWPVAMAPLYWPVLGLLGLLLAVGLVLGVPTLLARTSRSIEGPAPLSMPENLPNSDLSAPASPELSVARQPAAEGDQAPVQRPSQLPPPLPAQPVEALADEPDQPLLAELGMEDRLKLLTAARAEPGAGRLVLVVTASWMGLEPAERQRQADAWQDRAQALGYERLVLEDGQGGVLARAARVGSGMILLAPPLPADVRGS